MSEDTGNATVNGDQKAPPAPAQPAPESKPESYGSVPYARFQEVVEQRKGLESTLTSLIDGMVAELPEDMRSLVPPLPPADKAAWIRAAQAKGLFSKGVESVSTPANGPDAKRPGAKQPIDFNEMSPTEKLRFGFSQKK